MIARAAPLVVFLLLAGCSGGEGPDNPEGAVRLFIAAARIGDRRAEGIEVHP